jgi:hypothetical protein
MKTLSAILSGYGVQVPRERREGGRSVVEVAMIVALPMLIAVDAGGVLLLVEELVVLSVEEEAVGLARVRSPRRWASGMRRVRPARVMLGVPDIKARRETLLPESWRGE